MSNTGRAADKETWEKTLQKSLARTPERQEKFTTTSGIEVERLYGPWDLQGFDYEKDLGFPGQYPYTRGVYPAGYRSRPWTVRPITGFQDSRATNARLRKLLTMGQTGIHFVPDLPTYRGMDSDHPLAGGEVGLGGSPFDTLVDMENLLEGIPLDRVSTSFSTWGVVLFAMYLAVAQKQGVPFHKLNGTTQNDVLLYYHSCPFFDLPLRANFKLFADLVEYTARHVPNWHPVSISGYNCREGGCSAAQEIAFALGDAIAYIEACLERGLGIDEFAPRFSFMLCAHNNFFEEIAKMRALRRMWARLVREKFGAKDPRSLMLRFHTQTSGVALTAQQPLNNVVRGTLHALAAVLGGTQSLHVSCYDEALGLPTEEAVRLSVATQNIVAHESGVADTVDPLGGSYFVESLTNQLEEKAEGILKEIESQGGMVAATLNGWVPRQKAAYAWEEQREIEERKKVVVGVNAFEGEEERSVKVLKIDPQCEKEQVERLTRIKEERDQGQVREGLARLKEACGRGENTVTATLEAVKTYASLGEIYNAYHEVFGQISAQEIAACTQFE